MAPGEGGPCPSWGWTERITLPLLQRMETEKKKAEDKREKLHPAQAKGSDSEQEEPTFEGKGSPRETHPNQGQFHRHSEIDYTTMWKRQDHTAKM